MLIRMYCTCHDTLRYVRMYVRTCVHTYVCTYVQISVTFVCKFHCTYVRICGMLLYGQIKAQSVKIFTIFAHFTLLYVSSVYSKSANATYISSTIICTYARITPHIRTYYVVGYCVYVHTTCV